MTMTSENAEYLQAIKTGHCGAVASCNALSCAVAMAALSASQPPATLAEFHGSFRALVEQHIREALADKEWRRLRALAGDARPQRRDNNDAGARYALAALLDAGISEAGLAVTEICDALPQLGDGVAIGLIEGRPVCYFAGSGIYCWSPAPDEPLTLMFWITHPAYPPGW